jgi:hypothetical protein
MEFTQGWTFENFALDISAPTQERKPTSIEEQERLK